MADYGQLPLSDLRVRLAEFQIVTYRLALFEFNGAWRLFQLVVDAAPAAGKIKWGRYDYGDTLFVAGRLAPAELSEWFTAARGTAGGYEFRIPALNERTSFHRFPSYATQGGPLVRLPHTRYSLGTNDLNYGPSHAGFLVAEDAPTFADVNTACAKLLFDQDEYWSRSGSDVGQISVADDRGWIKTIDVGSASVRVRVAGRKLDGACIEFQGRDFEKVTRIGRRRTFTLYVPPPFPPQPLVLLKAGNEWLDYVHLGQWSPFSQDQRPGLRFEEPDLATRARTQIGAGESGTVEFKEIVPDRAEGYLRTVAAFANGTGGVVFFGVRNDNWEIVGLQSADLDREMSRIGNAVHNRVVPTVRTELRPVVIDGKPLIALYVSAGPDKPYGLRSEPPLFYVRHNGTTFPARQDEVQALAISSVQVVAGTPSIA